MNDLILTDFEREVCDLIRPHTAAHPTHSRSLARQLGLTGTRRIRKAVETAIRGGALIGSASVARKGIEAGWFWIQNESDMEAACGEMGSRIMALEQRKAALMIAWARTQREDRADLVLPFSDGGLTNTGSSCRVGA